MILYTPYPDVYGLGLGSQNMGYINSAEKRITTINVYSTYNVLQFSNPIYL